MTTPAGLELGGDDSAGKGFSENGAGKCGCRAPGLFALTGLPSIDFPHCFPLTALHRCSEGAVDNTTMRTVVFLCCRSFDLLAF